MNLSTTLSTNAIVEGKTEEVGVLVAGGPGIDPENHRVGGHFHVLGGSVDHRGTEVAPLDEAGWPAPWRPCRRAGCASSRRWANSPRATRPRSRPWPGPWPQAAGPTM
jgi:N-methylhydantoinase A/oxoprolinase/acetone carboxylase beta subunit